MFVLLTFAASWLLWLAAAAAVDWDFSMRSGNPAIGMSLYLLGVWAPTFVAVALTARTGGRAAVSALVRRVLHGAVDGRWYLFALGYFVAIRLTVALLHRAVFGQWPAFNQELLPLMLLAAIFLAPGQAGEEVGWRGYLLPGLTPRLGLPGASLAVGVIWACWHLPFFFIAGADKSGQPFLPYLLSVTALSVAMAWLYWRTTGSLLLTMLMHSAVNNMNLLATSTSASGGVLALNAPFVSWSTTALLGIGAIFFLVAMRGRRIQ